MFIIQPTITYSVKNVANYETVCDTHHGLDHLTFCEGCHQGEDKDGEHAEADARGRPHGECRQVPAKKQNCIFIFCLQTIFKCTLSVAYLYVIVCYS